MINRLNDKYNYMKKYIKISCIAYVLRYKNLISQVKNSDSYSIFRLGCDILFFS